MFFPDLDAVLPLAPVVYEVTKTPGERIPVDKALLEAVPQQLEAEPQQVEAEPQQPDVQVQQPEEPQPAEPTEPIIETVNLATDSPDESSQAPKDDPPFSATGDANDFVPDYGVWAPEAELGGSRIGHLL